MNRWLLGARPRTLPAAIVPVAVGTAAAVGTTGIIWWRAGAALVVAGALQVGTNFANDYSDGVRGTDGEQRVGPPRLVGGGLATPAQVKRAAMLCFGVAGVVGFFVALAVGPELFVVGALSIAAGWFYTGGPRPYGYAGLGEVFVFVFFGLVATIGSTYVHTESISGTSVLAAVVVGLPVTSLLVINNLRDIPGDTASGKRTLAVRIGDMRTRFLYMMLIVASFVLLLPLAAFRIGAVAAVVAVPLAVRAAKPVMAEAKGSELIAVLGATGQMELVLGLALALGLALSS
ncbi:MAG: 1,4-dihydroxy-2-naphthoate polyprenyltransferase [Acidimicrobiales bacterium]